MQLLESLKHTEFPPFNVHTNNNNICIQFFFNIRCLKIIKKKNLTHAKYDNYIIILSPLLLLKNSFSINSFPQVLHQKCHLINLKIHHLFQSFYKNFSSLSSHRQSQVFPFCSSFEVHYQCSLVTLHINVTDNRRHRFLINGENCQHFGVFCTNVPQVNEP